MAEVFAKFRVGAPGAGAAHASYITRSSALEPTGERVRGNQLELYDDQFSTATAIEQDLGRGSLGERGQSDDADPIWTWNAPSYLTGEYYGIEQDKSSRVAEQVALRDEALHDKIKAGINSPDRGTRLEEKTARLRAYFGSKERFEKAKGGRTHYRVILSFDVPATNEQIRELSNRFLKETFPTAIGFGAIHRDTEHPHVHIYLHARQIDGRKIYLSKNEYTSIDEKWAKIYSEFAGERSVFVQHVRKKEETRQWKIAAAEAYRKGEPIPPKPERDNDRRERLAEQRLSAERSLARDEGKHLRSRPPAEPVIRPASERETSRLMAKTEVAREELAHLIRTDAPAKQVKWAAKVANEFGVALENTLAARKEMGKERLPQAVHTIEEFKQMKEYAGTRDLAVRDDQTAARLQATLVVAGANVKDAQVKVDAFETRRHFWKFEVEGLGKTSLREVEQQIKNNAAEKFKLYNFLRPSKRQTIQQRIEFLQETKRDIQKQIVAAERPARNNLSAARLTYQTAAKLIEHTEKSRAGRDREMPLPVFEKAELIRMSEIANRTKDAKLLEFVYHEVRDSVLARPSVAVVSDVKGKAVMAQMEMLKAADRLKATVEFGEYRPVPIKDASGLTHTKSVRDVEPKNALETLIRHFTDSPDQRRDRQAVGDARDLQLRTAEAQSRDARDYSVIRDRIAQDFYRAAGVLERDVPPRLSREQIAELAKYAETLPLLSYDRREFKEAVRIAEHNLQQREAEQVGRRDAEHPRSQNVSARPREQSPASPTVSSRQADRDTFSRGR